MASDPQLYFLNERHQLAPTEKKGGGRYTKILDVDWKAHGASIKTEMASVRDARQRSADPTAQHRAFVVAAPSDSVKKSSTAKAAKDGAIVHEINIHGSDAQLIERLGFDLLAVQEDGSAIVHATDERLEQMMLSLGHLDRMGGREQNKWAHIKSIGEIPSSYKTNINWWRKAKEANGLLESVIDLQPFLERQEVESVISAIRARLGSEEGLYRIFKEYSGRTKLFGKLTKPTIVRLAKSFQSIFSIHPPIGATPSAESDHGSRAQSVASSMGSIARTLPCVAVVDTGVPEDHRFLGDYIRRIVVGTGTGGTVCDSHGSYVATRVVFGDVACQNGSPTQSLSGLCSVYDVRVRDGPGKIYPYAIIPAMGTVIDSAPDVRVFNLSTDINQDLDDFKGSHRDAVLRQIADLDNKIFSDDIFVVVAAGNSVPNILPREPYPRHLDDPQWQLRAWARSFNSMTCGGTADNLAEDGVAAEAGAPSPFTRIGPGFAGSPKPDLSAHAGNGNEQYQFQAGSGHGVWSCNEDGLWEDVSGTSFAAPLVAREAARLFEFLEDRCENESRPFACLVKACLALRARLPNPTLSPPYKRLADRTLGYGAVTLENVVNQTSERAVFLWQGIIPSEDDSVKIQLPVPGRWIDRAASPVLRLVAAWDSPVNHASEDIWACRNVSLTLRPSDAVGVKAIVAKNKRGSSRYPLLKREYHLDTSLSDQDEILMTLSYSNLQMAPYPAGDLDFSPQQRVGVAFELYDDVENPVSPHEHIQTLPVANSLNRLSHQVPASRQAISIKVP